MLEHGECCLVSGSGNIFIIQWVIQKGEKNHESTCIWVCEGICKRLK